MLIAGGIGITPLRAMAARLQSEGRCFQLHYAGRSMDLLVYRDQLKDNHGEQVILYPGDEGARLDIDKLIGSARPDAQFYVCGPARLIEAVQHEARAQGIADDRIHFERFEAASPSADDKSIRVKLKRSSIEIDVGPDETILDAVLDAGVEADYGCKAGACGTCAVKVLEGEAVHRDEALSDDEREKAGLMCPCVSRAKSANLTLDL